MNKYNTLDEQIVSMRLKGLIQREIAEELNITRDKVAYVLKKKSVTKPEYKRECRHCKEEFTTNNARKVNCSEVCRHRHNSRSKGSTYNCNYCGDKYKGYRVRDNCTQGCKEQERQDLYEKKKLLLRLTRAVDPKRQKDCLECGIRFHAKRRGSRYCSSRCNQTHYHRANYKPMEHNHKCRECGKHYTDNRVRSAGCSGQCKRRYDNRVSDTSRRHKLRENGKIDWDISVERLVHRDKNTCYLCEGSINSNDYVRTREGYHIAGDYFGSIDHVIPVVKGGTHTWGNVKLAHRICNSMKADNTTHKKTQMTLF